MFFRYVKYMKNCKCRFLFVLILTLPLISSPGQSTADARQELIEVLINGKTPSEKLLSDGLDDGMVKHSELFTGELLEVYINEYFASSTEPIPRVDRFLLTKFSLAEKINLLKNLGRTAVFNPFSDVLYAHLAGLLSEEGEEAASDEQEEEIRFALDYYTGRKIYKTVATKTGEDWRNIFKALQAAMDIRPLQNDTEIFLEAAKKTGEAREVFRLQVFRYYNQGDERLLRRIGLFFRYLITPDKKGRFREELSAVRNNLKHHLIAETIRNTPENLPDFASRGLYSPYKDGEVAFDVTSRHSPVYGKGLLLVFFSTSCGHCIYELRTLSEMNDLLLKKDIFTAGVNTNIISQKKLKEEIPSFFERNRIELPVFSDINNGNSLFIEYGIDKVPLIVLFDADGKPVAKIQLYHTGHLELKLSWLLEEFLDVSL